MKIYPTFKLVVFVIASSAYAATHELTLSATEYPIDSVNLYPSNRADISRVFPLHLHQGENIVLITQLSSGIISSDLQIKASAPFKTTLKGVASAKKPRHPSYGDGYGQDEDEELKELRRRRGDAELKERRLDLRYDTLYEYTRAMKPANTNLSDFSASLEYFEEEATRLRSLIHSTRADVKRLREEETALEAKKGGNKDLRSSVTVKIWAEKAGDAVVSLKYGVKGAKWKPVYDARVVEEGTWSAKLEYGAVVEQSTGEDWIDVDLILATSQPSFSPIPPTLDPWFLSPPSYIPPQRRGAQQFNVKYSKMVTHDEFLGDDEDELMGAGMPENVMMDLPSPLEEAEKMQEAGVNQAQVGKQSQLSVSLEVPGKTTILSRSSTSAHSSGRNGKKEDQTVSIAEWKMEADMEWLVVPSKDTEVYLTAKVKNDLYPLLPGPLAIYLHDAFVARSSFDSMISPGETFNLHLGVDRAIRVEYPPLRRHRASRGLLQGSLTKMDAWKMEQYIKIINSHPPSPKEKEDGITIKVAERIPMSTDSRIQVRLLHPPLPMPLPAMSTNEEEKGASQKIASIDGANGRNVTAKWKDEKKHEIEWTLTLDGGSEEEIRLEWEVVAQAGMGIQGF
ncbi:hypothetical protein BT69DRAFT_1315033 [Atractiella rhizophila]|nr:hypothetical protein BT69DRAFT_1315033 [Atractiella rhizophila]